MFFKKKEEDNIDVLQKIKEKITEGNNEEQSSVSDESFLNDILMEGDFSGNKKTEDDGNIFADSQKLIDDINKTMGGSFNKDNSIVDDKMVDELLDDNVDDSEYEDINVDNESKDESDSNGDLDDDLDDGLDDILDNDIEDEDDDINEEDNEEDELLGVINKQKNNIEEQKNINVENNNNIRSETVNVNAQNEERIMKNDEDLILKDNIKLNVDVSNDDKNGINKNSINDANFGQKDNLSSTNTVTGNVKSDISVINNINDNSDLNEDHELDVNQTKAFVDKKNDTDDVNKKVNFNTKTSERIDTINATDDSKLTIANDANLIRTNSLTSDEAKLLDDKKDEFKVKNDMLQKDIQQKNTSSTLDVIEGRFDKNSIDSVSVVGVEKGKNTTDISSKTKNAVKGSITELIENVKKQILSEKSASLPSESSSEEQIMKQFIGCFILPKIIDSLEPKITEYLDLNLEKIVKDIVNDKIREIIDGVN